MSKLSDKHRRFANEYFKTGKAGPSYKKYYNCTPRAACTAACRLLKRDDVQAHIKKLEATEVEVVAEEKVYNERDALVAETRIADVDITEIFDENGMLRMPQDWPMEIKKAIKAIEMDKYTVSTKDADGNVITETRPYVKKITFNRRGGALDRLEKCFYMVNMYFTHLGPRWLINLQESPYPLVI